MRPASLFALLAISACHTTSQPELQSSASTTDLRAALSGKTLSHPDVTVVVDPNGQLTGTESDGTEIVGTWTITNGQWCRTLTAPESFAGSACQGVAIVGDQATFKREDGSSITYTIS